LGAGCGFPGLVAAACGSTVVLSDREEEKEVLENLRANFLSNHPLHVMSKSVTFHFILFFSKLFLLEEKKLVRVIPLNITILPFTWGNFSSQVLCQETPDIILASDVCYDNSRDFETLLASVRYFMQREDARKKGICFFMSYQERRYVRVLRCL